MSDQGFIWAILLSLSSDCEGLGQGQKKESVSDNPPSTIPGCSYFWLQDPQNVGLFLLRAAICRLGHTGQDVESRDH